MWTFGFWLRHCVCFKSKPHSGKKKRQSCIGYSCTGPMCIILILFFDVILNFFPPRLDFLPSDEAALKVDIKAASIEEQSGAYKQAQQQEVSRSSGLSFRLWIRPIEMIWEGCGNRDSAADKLGRRSEKEMLLSMTLLLLLTASHKPPLSDTRLGPKQPFQSHLRK